MRTSLSTFNLYNFPLSRLEPGKKLLINTLNAYSFKLVQNDENFLIALRGSDILLPDGISIVLAALLLYRQRLKKIAGADLFFYEMERINQAGGKCFFLGSSEETLKLIRDNAANEYPGLKIYTYSPPYKPEFSKEDNKAMIEAVNAVSPDVLFVGMTAPKQEKWAYNNFSDLRAGHVCCIGAVFDFYAGTFRRAPAWMIFIGLEWFYRLIMEPRRMWRRYLIGNITFVYLILLEFVFGKGKNK